MMQVMRKKLILKRRASMPSSGRSLGSLLSWELLKMLPTGFALPSFFDSIGNNVEKWNNDCCSFYCSDSIKAMLPYGRKPFNVVFLEWLPSVNNQLQYVLKALLLDLMCAVPSLVKI